jgi:UDP-4-amino-4,6-dideoxy-N-acetyl-beta-L-altrosamine transaminase
MIPYGRQDINQEDIEAVIAILKSDFLTQGPTVPEFEKKVAEYCGVNYGVAVNSATSALHIACMALDLGPGDYLWTSPNTFVASANCAIYCGAQVDFVDIDPRTYNLSVRKLEEKLEEAEREGRLPKIVVPVHFAGQSCEMEEIHKLSQKYGFKIIEDASHAIGGRYKNKKVGSCEFSDITVFSFHPVKIITTGEGGMAMTNQEDLAERMRRYRTHGITSKKELMSPRPPDEIWNYQQIDLGYNYRMTDLEAALGISQMNRIDEFVSKRQTIAGIYDRELSKLPITTPWQHPDTYSSYHLYSIRVNQEKSGKSQKEVYEYLWQSGIAVNLHYIPVHRQPYYESKGFKSSDYPNAEIYHKEVLSIPVYASLNEDQLREVIEVITKALK